MFISRIGTCCTEQSKAVISRGTLSKVFFIRPLAITKNE